MKEGKDLDAGTYGMLAEFANPHELIEAAKGLRHAGYELYDAHSPYPIHGMDRAMGLKDSKLGWFVMAISLLGGIGIFILQAWATVVAYPHIISGKPLLSTEAYIPAMFELFILSAGFTTVFGMFALNKLPQFYHPLFKSKHFHKASTHGFFISVEAEDTQFDVVQTEQFLVSIGGKNVEVIEN